ncbi:glycosyltransferase family 2 protein [Flammeovirgaceae bacterium SG7u.111]|nr:glycosyltransferase family 2 protein [Flammeovirgaceae bacterium SG7u.132]WPO34974.1 glycosyltransferase family 2 protein [Flammeovirgaceae bacterium SG7u.111]
MANSTWPKEEINPTIYSEDIKWPKISIVTPSYNQGQYIEETILSIKNQNYPNIEFIIIDGGSTDCTLEIIKKYEKYITYWVSEKDRGQSHAINKGLEKCTGDIFNWLNSDDYLEPYALYNIALGFQAPHTKVVSGIKRTLSGNKRNLNEPFPLVGSTMEALSEPSYAQPETFYKMDVVRKITPLTEGLHYSMDLAMWYQYLLLYGIENVISIKKVIVNFRYHGESKTVTGESNFGKEQLLIYQSIFDILRSPQTSNNLIITKSQIIISEDEITQAIHLGYFKMVLKYKGLFSKKDVVLLIQKIDLKALGRQQQLELNEINFTYTASSLIKTMVSIIGCFSKNFYQRILISRFFCIIPPN